MEFFNEVNIFDELADGTRSVKKSQKHQRHSAHVMQSSAGKKSPRDVATAPLKGTEADEPLASKEPESGTESAATYFVSDPPPHAVGASGARFFCFEKESAATGQISRATCQVDFYD